MQHADPSCDPKYQQLKIAYERVREQREIVKTLRADYPSNRQHKKAIRKMARWQERILNDMVLRYHELADGIESQNVFDEVMRKLTE